jgi:hypothetical protein
MGILRRRDPAEREEMKKRGSSHFVGLAIVVVSVVFLVAAIAFFFWKPDVIFDVDDEAVASSVADELPERLFVDPCKSLGERRWTCVVTVGESSDARTVYRGFRVELDEDRCWTVIAPRDNQVASKEGCLGLTDYLFEEETFLD